VTAFLAKLIEIILKTLSIPESLSVPLISGLFEITQGSQMTSQVQDAPLMQLAIITSFILAFSGFSVQAQVASILAQTDIRFKPFFFARILQGLFASFFTVILWKTIYERFYNPEQPSHAIPVFLFEEGSWLHSCYHLISQFGPIITLSFLCLYIVILARRLYVHK
jgi:nucleoside recognition membrane protein YjiH